MLSNELIVFLAVTAVLIALYIGPRIRNGFDRQSNYFGDPLYLSKQDGQSGEVADMLLNEANTESDHFASYLHPVKCKNDSTFLGISSAHLVTVDGVVLPGRSDLKNHSPTGFDWGFYGAGSAQLALAILAWEFDDKTALSYYQQYASDVVAILPKDSGFCITSADLQSWLDQL